MVCSSGTSIFDRQEFLQRRVIMNQNLMVCSSGTSIFGRQEFCFQAEPCHEKLLLIQDHFLSPVLAVRGAGGQSGEICSQCGQCCSASDGRGTIDVCELWQEQHGVVLVTAGGAAQPAQPRHQHQHQLHH